MPSQFTAVYHELAATPACDHFFSAAYPVRECRWCQLSAKADRLENAEARRLGHAVPNQIGGR